MSSLRNTENAHSRGLLTAKEQFITASEAKLRKASSDCFYIRHHYQIRKVKKEAHTIVFPTKVIGSAFGPRAREKTHRVYADLSSYAINKLFRPRNNWQNTIEKLA